MGNLLIITGAGASFDVVDSNIVPVKLQYQPPLTKDLFYRRPVVLWGADGKSQEIDSYVNKCLQDFPVASKVGLDYKMHLERGKEEESLEKYLYNIKTHKKILTRNQFWSVPIYLHALFSEISRSYISIKTQKPIHTNYKLLIEEINNGDVYEQVIWLNLNYDLLADYAIADSVTRPLNNMADYMRLETPDGLKIKYTKPHGSVNWFKGLNCHGFSCRISWDMIGADSTKLPIDFEKRLSKGVYTRHEWSKLVGEERRKVQYPAITAPLGEYEFVCSDHENEIKKELVKTSSVLCIGFNALDKDVLDLMKIIPKIEKLKIVNGDKMSGGKAYQRIVDCRSKVEVGKEDSVFAEGFSEFMKRGIISKWLSQ